jgi:2-phospho-L-lactate guanylyltransferase
VRSDRARTALVPGVVAVAGEAQAGPEWSGDWTVALPLKRLARAKTRMLLPPDVRASVALAMALDTAAAALGSPVVSSVLVICGADAAPAFEELGCRVLLDRGDGGLNEVLLEAWEHARTVAPRTAFASLVADLPGLRPQHLTAALVEAGRHERSFVPDAAGTGTTLLAVLPGAVYAPSYGTASARRHGLAGATPLSLPAGSPLRRDVDTLTDLGGASESGVGPRTVRLIGAALDAASRPPGDTGDLAEPVAAVDGPRILARSEPAGVGLPRTGPPN